jgi:dolichol-phosphate mannosyltransferase
MLSVVTASYNEAENVPRLAERLRAALGGLEHELILVDDSSPDGTADVASRYFDRVIVMDHAGQTACLLEGIRSSRGDLVVTIDADLENPPELVPLMLQTAKAMGCDVLVASRTVLFLF